MTPKDIHTGSSFSVFTVLKCFCFHFKKGHMRSYMKTLLPGCQYSSEASLNCCNSSRLTSDQKPHGNEESLRRTKQNISSVQSLSHVQLFVAPWITAHQASLSIINPWSSLKLMSIELVMPSSHLIRFRPLLLLSAIPPSIRVFSNESTLCIKWPKYWSFSFSITCCCC